MGSGQKAAYYAELEAQQRKRDKEGELYIVPVLIKEERIEYHRVKAIDKSDAKSLINKYSRSDESQIIKKEVQVLEAVKR